ncbi:MAG: endo alpha-1,4 polygalactosaminidase [Myxococcales bacterium]|nr:endo alpha-1,4 polygalactosaminidase [Myxococcales bacterium]MCB9716769.1 endo alpha-1,4 polygalactosaminidase [Myxococcales bacterium]
MIARAEAPWTAITTLATVLGCGGASSDDDDGASTVPATAGEGGSTEGATSSEPGTGTGTATDEGPGSEGTATDGTDGGSTSDEPPPGCGSPPVWCPGPSTSWQWQLTGPLDTSLDVAMYDVDLFDNDAGTIADLQAQGRVAICYFSAGSHEDWRPDADQFPAPAIGMPLDGWPGERWLDVRDETVRQVLAARLDLAVSKGCDGVEPDNVDGYSNDTGFPLSAADQLDFNTWLAGQAHMRGLSVGLKNDLDQIGELLPHFDWALDEECMAYDECDRLAPFVDAGKAVFHVEYVDDPAQGPELAAQICPDALDRSFSTLVKGWDLDAWVIPCE